MTTHEHVLEGCRPVPLAHYLKALGILRLVGEQADAEARGFWRRDRFVLRTRLDRDALERFFLEDYEPTPLVGPWGARSGFYPEGSEKAAREALDQIEASGLPRLRPFVRTLAIARGVLRDLGISSKAEVGGRKREVMEACRARLPDPIVPWLDACFALLADDERYPPILGTGGNEGSGSYMSGFAQQVAACLVDRKHDAALIAALWGIGVASSTTGQTSGHFLPEAGGHNRGMGFVEEPSTNPWDYLLCLEGSLLFASSISRRSEALPIARMASFPFTVESSPVGYSTAIKEQSRGELWLPIWERPASHGEVQRLFNEGRATTQSGPVRSGLDFARAVASLGVDRGVVKFERYGIQERNGQNNIAVWLGEQAVRSRPLVRILHDIDRWHDAFRSKADRDGAPASVRRALRQLDSAIFDLCQRGDELRLQQVLIALGRCEWAMATSMRWTQEARMSPVPPLSPAWLSGSDDGSVELRLAASLASVVGGYSDHEGRRIHVPLRRQLEPVTTWSTDGRLGVWWDFEADRDVVWTSGSLVPAMNQIMARRLVLASRGRVDEGYPDRGGLWASLGDVADFIEGRVDEGRLAELLWGAILLDWVRVDAGDRPAPRIQPLEPFPGAFYALVKLCFAGCPVRVPSARQAPDAGEPVPLVPQVHRLAAAGRGSEAARQAIRRLRGSGFAPAFREIEVSGSAAVRSAAALLFPLGNGDVARLARLVLRPDQDDHGSDEIEQTTTHEGAMA